jgi:hypothetical protein
MYSELAKEFADCRVVDFDDEACWQGSNVAYRLREEYDDKVTIADRLARLLGQPGSDQLKALIIGAWSKAAEGDNSGQVVAELIQAAPALPEIRALFFGDITYEESELSWINQSDLSPLLDAFPKLAELRVRGGNGLSFSKTRHACLKKLAVETGGLPSSALRELQLCDFPNLEHLELLLGEENYGFDGGVEDLQPLLSGKVFPKLKFLGLMNSEIADELAAVLVNAPVVEQLETLDLSMGNLSDEGIHSLAALANHAGLQRLNISHHYGSKSAVKELAGVLSCQVIADEPQEPDDEWRPIVHAE